MKIIGMTGYAGSGKDTVANILVRDHGFVKVAFADPLKRICRDVYGFTDEQLWGPSEKRNAPDTRYPRKVPSFDQGDAFEAARHGIPDPGKIEYLTPRYALQKLGTEWARDCYENTWVDYALRIAEALLAGGHEYSARSGLVADPITPWPRSAGPKGVVISDVRFPNEVAALRGRGARIWRTVHGHGLEGAAALHQSEKHIDKLEVQFTFPRCGLDVLPTAVKAALMPEHWQPAWHATASGSPPEVLCEFRDCIEAVHFGGRL